MISREKRQLFLLGFALIIVGAICYQAVPRLQFVIFDDPTYLRDNPHVRSGLSWANVVWAFQTGYFCSWHPLTWLSHMLDVALYGLNPAGHHLTSLFFHLVNTVLLFVLLRQVTGAVWRSFFAAAVFGWHPIHVESVAWVSERKDVLSAFFFLLTLIAYSSYTKKLPGRGRYWLALLFFALGLMSKPMLVTLPCVLLLWDFWPLNRLGTLALAKEDRARCFFKAIWPLVLEKVPFFMLSLGSSIVTFIVQRQGGAVSSLETLPLSLRLSNSIVTYVRYVLKMIWPIDLSVTYPLPHHWPAGIVCAAVLLLGLVSFVTVREWRRRPYLATGWFWYLGMLVPVIGLVQVGSQAMADRYTYLPGIGLSLAVIWGLADLLAANSLRVPALKYFPAGATALILAIFTALTVKQVGYWKNSETLFHHALRVNRDNYVACDGYANALDEVGKRDEGLFYHFETIRLAPGYPQGRFNLGTVLLERGRVEEAITNLQAAVRFSPALAEAHHTLGSALMQAGRAEESRASFVNALRLKPDNADTHHALGTLLLNYGQAEGAAIELTEAVRLNPQHVEARRNLGVALARLGRRAEAAAQFAEAARQAPNRPEMRLNYGLALFDLDRPAEALPEFLMAIKLNPADSHGHYQLARVYARMNQPAEAIAQYRETLRLKPDFQQAATELAGLEKTAE